jgi:hypothetical protein
MLQNSTQQWPPYDASSHNISEYRLAEGHTMDITLSSDLCNVHTTADGVILLLYKC